MKHVSASQVQSWVDCHRRWYFDYPLKLKAPPSPKMERGTRVHKHLEEYLREGKIPPDKTREGRMARAALEHIPDPGTEGLLIEHRFELFTGQGLPPWLGFIDLIVSKAKPPIVHDHKTTSSFDWAKRPIDLLLSPQMVSYGNFLMDEVVKCDEVLLKHLYILDSEHPACKPVPVVARRDQIKHQWEINVDRVRAMKDVEDAHNDGRITPDDVTPNPSACSMYGGCPHRLRCGLENKGAAFTMGTTPPGLQLLQHKTRSILPPDAPKPTTVVTTPEPPVPGATVFGKFYCLPGYQPTGGTVPMNGEDVPTMKDANGQLFAMLPLPNVYVTGHQHGADAVAAIAPNVEAPGQSGVITSAETAQEAGVVVTQDMYQTPPAAVVEVAAEVEATAEVTTETKKRGRGRPKKDPTATIAAPQPPPLPEPTLSATVEEGKVTIMQQMEQLTPQMSQKPAMVQAPAAASGLELWIDCHPTKGAPEVQAVEDWIQPALDVAAKDAGVPDWRCVDYNKGKGYLFAALKSLTPPKGVVLLRSTMAGYDVVREFLTPHAKRIIVGARE